MGDFNDIITPSEHKGNSFYYYARKASYFSKFIADNNLIDVRFSGATFSWYNGQRGLARRCARLDRCLVNNSWLACSYSIHIRYLPEIFSDHSPMLINMAKINFNTRRIFHFENYWLEHVDYIFIIRQALFASAHSSPMHAFHHVLERVCSNRQYGLGNLDKVIKNTEVQLQALEVNDMLSSNSNLDSYRSLQNNYRALLRQYYSR